MKIELETRNEIKQLQDQKDKLLDKFIRDCEAINAQIRYLRSKEKC